MDGDTIRFGREDYLRERSKLRDKIVHLHRQLASVPPEQVEAVRELENAEDSLRRVEHMLRMTSAPRTWGTDDGGPVVVET